MQLLLEYYETTKGSEAWYSGPDLDGGGYLVWKGDKKKSTTLVVFLNYTLKPAKFSYCTQGTPITVAAVDGKSPVGAYKRVEALQFLVFSKQFLSYH